MPPVISIIIPCYNSGAYLQDALESIKDYPHKNNYEVIIINDGSTDDNTLTLLHQLHIDGYTVLHQENKGPAAARNTGIKFSSGRYLLFLDSDNKIRSAYIEKGIKVLDAFKEVGIVYGNPSFFGDSSELRFVTGEFDIYKMLNQNYIDICSVIRKKVFDQVGGFDEERTLIGHEDWDFWIRANRAGFKFHYIQETLFDYRVTHDSLIRQASQPARLQKVLQYIYQKHVDIYVRHYKGLHQRYVYYQHDREKPFRSLFKFYFLRYFSKSK